MLSPLMSTPFSLVERHNELTRQLIVTTAVELLTEAPFADLSAQTIADRAGISRRTVFRQFEGRESLLQAIAREVVERLDLPPEPNTAEELLEYPAALFRQFERHSELTGAALNSELYEHVRGITRKRRGESIDQLIEAIAADRPLDERRRAAANIQYHLVATAWHYYRFHFGLPLSETIDCARTAIRDILAGLGVRTGEAE
jgi:AcrR family transcriptional regulator